MADRIEREIEEILRKIDDFVPETSRQRRPRRNVSRPFAATQAWLAKRLAAISLNQVMMWSLVLVLASFVFRAMPGAGWVLIGGVIVFLTALVISIATGGRAQAAPKEKRWRGQPVDYDGPSWPDRIKAFIKGKRRR